MKDHRRRYPRDLAEAEILDVAPVVEEVADVEPEAPKPLRSAEDLKVGEAREEQWGDTPISCARRCTSSADERGRGPRIR